MTASRLNCLSCAVKVEAIEPTPIPPLHSLFEPGREEL